MPGAPHSREWLSHAQATTLLSLARTIQFWEQLLHALARFWGRTKTRQATSRPPKSRQSASRKSPTSDEVCRLRLSALALPATTTPAPSHSPSPARPNQSLQRGAPVLRKTSCTPRMSANAPRYRQSANSLHSLASQSICPDTLRSSSQLLRQPLPREKQSRFHRAHRDAQHSRNFLQRVSLDRRQQQHQSALFRQLLHRPLQSCLELARHSQLLYRWAHSSLLGLLPLHLAHLSPLRRAPPVQRHSERNAHQPTAKPRRLSQPPEIPVRFQQRLLRDVFRVGRMPQYSIRHAKRQRPAL